MKHQNYSSIFLVFSKIIKSHFPKASLKRILVVGCGDGTEAIEIASLLNNSIVVGIDPKAVESKKKNYEIIKAQLDDISVKKSFDLIYCYHVLEHVDDIRVALKKIYSLLDEGGIVIVGLPNRQRIIGYVNPAIGISMATKIVQNLIDLKNRMVEIKNPSRKNHLGMTQSDGFKIMKKEFKYVRSVRDEYFIYKYPKLHFLLKLVMVLKIDNIIFPSNYFICKK
jgi:2-polyprenyl-3-methyl-5-hydroxy-6-metoxy-1,4-benzoquinol methylase